MTDGIAEIGGYVVNGPGIEDAQWAGYIPRSTWSALGILFVKQSHDPIWDDSDDPNLKWPDGPIRL